jgi:hypothetical protein
MSSRLTVSLFAALFFLFVLNSCEKSMPLENHDSDYQPEFVIEGDFFPANLAKSVVRIDRTFSLNQQMSIEEAHVKDASAALYREDGALLSTLSWNDTAMAYPYYHYNMVPGGVDQIPGGGVTGVGEGIDTLQYGAYTLDSLNFQLQPDTEYRLSVIIDSEEFNTSFTPHPVVDMVYPKADSIYLRKAYQGWEYPISWATLPSSTIHLEWADQPGAYFYTVSIQHYGSRKLVPRIIAVTEPVFTLSVAWHEFEIVIGSMNETIYRHYYLKEYPVNHPIRNFFDGKALGYAGTLSELYLRVSLEHQ